MQLTTRTVEYSLRQTKPLVGSQPVPTTTTRLAGVRRVHTDDGSSPGPFYLELEHPCESCPRRVRNRLGQTVVMEHPADLHIFHRYQPVLIDDTSAVLVSKVIPPPPGSLIHTSHHLTSRPSLWSTLLLPGKEALHLSQSFLLNIKRCYKIFN